MGFDPAQAFDPERFRREGRAVVDWIADYWQTVASRPVAAQVEPGWVRSQLPDRAPEALRHGLFRCGGRDDRRTGGGHDWP